MREIKFRAWLKGYDKMFYSEEPDSDESRRFFPFVFNMETKRDFSIDDFYFMQYVGLKDDNGKEMYEEDIISDISGNILTVEWNDDTCKFQFSDGSDINDGERYGTYKVVIGNIYENPELLNQNK